MDYELVIPAGRVAGVDEAAGDQLDACKHTNVEAVHPIGQV